jgi:hypothetical protein
MTGSRSGAVGVAAPRRVVAVGSAMVALQGRSVWARCRSRAEGWGGHVAGVVSRRMIRACCCAVCSVSSASIAGSAAAAASTMRISPRSARQVLSVRRWCRSSTLVLSAPRVLCGRCSAVGVHHRRCRSALFAAAYTAPSAAVSSGPGGAVRTARVNGSSVVLAIAAWVRSSGVPAPMASGSAT